MHAEKENGVEHSMTLCNINKYIRTVRHIMYIKAHLQQATDAARKYLNLGNVENVLNEVFEIGISLQYLTYIYLRTVGT